MNCYCRSCLNSEPDRTATSNNYVCFIFKTAKSDKSHKLQFIFFSSISFNYLGKLKFKNSKIYKNLGLCTPEISSLAFKNFLRSVKTSEYC